MNQRPGEQQAAFLASREALEHAVFIVRYAKGLHECPSLRDLILRGLQVIMSADGTKESGNDHIQRRGIGRVVLLQIVRDEAYLAPKVPEVDRFAAKEFEIALVLVDGIDLPADQFQQGTLARPIGAEDGNTLVVANPQ
ncbi:hypothetical protein D9M68_812780 [compost metagenome]